MWARAATTLLVTAACTATLAADGELPIKAIWVAGGLIAVAVGYLLFPGAVLARFGALRRAATWALIVGIVAGISISIGVGRSMPWPIMVGVLALTFFASTMTQFLHVIWPTIRAAPLLLLALLLATGLPIIAGPTLEQLYDATNAANTVVSLSPVSYFASLLQYDYLRSEWFYDHTPFGALRYDYPNPTQSTLFLLCVGMLLCWAADRIRFRKIQADAISLNTTHLEDNAL